MIDFENLTFEEAREAIKDILIKKFGMERVRRLDSDTTTDYDAAVDYGDRHVIWTIYSSNNNTVIVNMGIESGYVEEDKELRKDANNMFKLLGLTPSANNRDRNTETFTAKGEFNYLTPEKQTMKKMGKFKDLLDL